MFRRFNALEDKLGVRLCECFGTRYPLTATCEKIGFVARKTSELTNQVERRLSSCDHRPSMWRCVSPLSGMHLQQRHCQVAFHLLYFRIGCCHGFEFLASPMSLLSLLRAKSATYARGLVCKKVWSC